MSIKHLRLRGEKIHTRFGVVDLDSKGFVVTEGLGFSHSLLIGQPQFVFVEDSGRSKPSRRSKRSPRDLAVQIDVEDV
jgi:hypothetical protein